MMSRRRTVSGAAVVVALLGMAGCSSSSAGAGGPAASVAPATPAMIAAGQQLFTQRCQGCHGQAGAGTARGPNLADDQFIWIQANQPARPQISRIVHDGIPTPRQFMNPMPAVGAMMTQEQLDQIGAYVESL